MGSGIKSFGKGWSGDDTGELTCVGGGGEWYCSQLLVNVWQNLSVHVQSQVAMSVKDVEKMFKWLCWDKVVYLD